MCYCGSNNDFEVCCKPFIDGEKIPATAVDLMKSRYSAYVIKDIDYIVETTHPGVRKSFSKAVTKEWAEASTFTSLEIIELENGNQEDKQGIVEFKACYNEGGSSHVHHEKSLFEKVEDKWFYKGYLPVTKTIVKDKKIKRNDPCICGSGKKYKKCCGK